MFADGRVVIAQGGGEGFFVERAQTRERVQGVNARLGQDFSAQSVGGDGAEELVALGVVARDEQSLGGVALPAVGVVEGQDELLGGEFIEARDFAQLRAF